MPAAHRHGDVRKCGAVTNVIGQTTTFVNGKLWAVIGDPNSHGAGGLIPSGSTVFIQGKKVIVNAPDSADPDNLCPTEGGLHCGPLTHQGAIGTFAYGPGGEGVGGFILTPTPANLALSAAAPVRAQTNNIWLTASAANLALSGKVPVTSESIGRTVSAANLAFSSVAPVVTLSDNRLLVIPTGNIAGSGAAPSVSVSVHYNELREDGSVELREDGSKELRE